MAAKVTPGRDDSGIVITIGGADGQVVSRNSLAVYIATLIARETGTTVIVTDITRELRGNVVGRPIEVNPAPPPSKS